MDNRAKSGIYGALATGPSNKPFQIEETLFISPEILHREDAARRKKRLSRLVASEIVPRLRLLHNEVIASPDCAPPTEAEISELAHLVLSPNLQAAAAYVTLLRERGLTIETLFVELIQPAAQHLGRMWDNDECDFIDVTLGVGQLQKLLAVFNCTYDIPAINEKRRVFLTLTPGEQHSFGLDMVAKLMRAAGWNVTLEAQPTIKTIATTLATDWYAVAGVTLSSKTRIRDMAKVVAAIRKHSRNRSIGVMVGGAHFAENPDLYLEVRADATALNATTAVILAQKLFDLGAQTKWQGTAP